MVRSRETRAVYDERRTPGVLICCPSICRPFSVRPFLQAGLVPLTGGLLLGLTLAPSVGLLFDRYGSRPPVVPGMTVCAAALAATTLLRPVHSHWRDCGSALGHVSGIRTCYNTLADIRAVSLRLPARQRRRRACSCRRDVVPAEPESTGLKLRPQLLVRRR